MPQMKPMVWHLIMLISISTMIFIMTSIYFTMKFKMPTKNINLFSIKIMWA